jgi:hypothetical protein
MIVHEVTKKVEPGKRRVFFKTTVDLKGAEFGIVFKNWLGKELFNLSGKCTSVRFFYYDVPKGVWSSTNYMNVIIKPVKGNLIEETIKPSGKYERLI